MNKILSCLLFLVMTTAVMAANTMNYDKNYGKKDSHGKETRHPTEQNNKTKQSPQKKRETVHIFRPSEKIGADTVVDFPVDI
ncbi:MAG: hypothetical protein J7J52_05200 [Deltaproteobacteria bacterium]|nr:hypothetical protein [Deltaproteobacteria bacterium]